MWTIFCLAGDNICEQGERDGARGQYLAEEVDLASHGKHFHECHRSRGLPAPTYIQWGHKLVDQHNYNDIEDNMMLATTTIQWTTMNMASTMATMWH